MRPRRMEMELRGYHFMDDLIFQWQDRKIPYELIWRVTLNVIEMRFVYHRAFVKGMGRCLGEAVKGGKLYGL